MRQFLVNLFEKIYDHSRSKDGDPDNILFCEDTSYFRFFLGENTLLTSLITDTCDPVLLSLNTLFLFSHSYGSESSPIGDLSEVCHTVVLYPLA